MIWLLKLLPVGRLFGKIGSFLPFGRIRLTLTTILIVALIVVSLVLVIQNKRLDNSQKKTANLRAEIAGIKSAAILTERLRKDNADLTRRLTDMENEVHAAPSASQPLPDDIRHILDRLRDSAGAGHSARPR